MEKERIFFSEDMLRLNLVTAAADAAKPWRQLHFHDELEWIRVDNGSLRVHVDGDVQRLRQGDTILINRSVAHYLENEADAVITYIQLALPHDRESAAETVQTPFYEFIIHPDTAPYYVCAGSGELSDLFRAVCAELYEKRPFYTRYVKAYLMLLESFLFRHHLLADPAERQTMEKAKQLLPLVREIDLHYMQPISLDQLAERVGYSKFELCRKFKTVTGRTIVDYMNYVRLYHAKQLLRTTDAGITEIAYACGFSTAAYFNKTFKKYNGCPPGVYKKQSL